MTIVALIANWLSGPSEFETEATDSYFTVTGSQQYVLRDLRSVLLSRQISNVF